VAFSPDGQSIAAGTDDNIGEAMLWIWRTTNPEQPQQLSAHIGQILRLVFAPDSATIMTGSIEGLAKLWDAQSGKMLRELSHGAPVMDGLFTPDGSRLITSTLTGRIFVWDSKTGQSLEGPSAHAGAAVLEISGDGTRLASFSWDRTAKVWDTAAWREVATLTHREQVDFGAISPDGTRLITATPYDGFRIVPLDLAELIRLAKTRVQRDLTKEECRRYLREVDCAAFPR
jgi:WD40 repeat protein